MTNNATIFYEQQKSAFYSQHIDSLFPQDLEDLVAKLKPKKSAQFPPPEHIYKKRFAFLPTTLAVLQASKKPSPAANNVPVPSKEHPTIHAAVVSTNNNKAQRPANKRIPATEKPDTKLSHTNGKPKEKSKLGVELETRSVSGEGSDDSVVIPHEFEEIILAALQTQKRNPTDADEEFIESEPLSKREIKTLREDVGWVDDLLSSDTESPSSGRERKVEGLRPRSNVLLYPARGPLLLEIKDVVRVSTPLRQQYDV